MAPPDVPWIVEARIEARIQLPTGEVVERDEFHDWLWERAAGLVGIDEGAVTVDEAVTRGLEAGPLVIDIAAAPSDRDWVAGLGVEVEAWWFSDESAARAAVALVVAVAGCRVERVRPDRPGERAAELSAFEAIPVPGFGLVRPAWEDGVAGIGGDGAATIFIEPGVGFGTGLHATTQLCLAAIAERRRQGGSCDRVLDFGSGSGILAIAAAVCGARQVAAIEIDDRVHGAIVANARRNGVADQVTVTATIPAAAGPHDLVLANIVAPVLVQRAADLCRVLARPDGELVLSGLLAADVAEVAEVFAGLVGRRPVMSQRGDWRCLAFGPA